MKAVTGNTRTWLVVVSILVVMAGHSSAFYGRGSDVIQLKSQKDITALTNSKFAWFIELYREGCGYCQQLTPEYNKAATKLRKLVRVAAVDVEKNRDIAQKIMSMYNFQVKGVPTLIALKPRTKKGDGTSKERIDYNGERKAGAISKFALNLMPDYSRLVTKASFPGFQSKSELPKALLFTDKSSSPPIFKALSTKYKDRMTFGYVQKSNKDLAKLFGVTEFPAVYVIKKGDTIEQGGSAEPVPFTGGKPSFMALDVFLMDYAEPKQNKKSSSSQSKSKSSTSKKPTPTKKPAKATTKKAAFKKPIMPQPKDKIKLAGTDLNKLKLKQLRGILARWDDKCSGCMEKFHFVDRINELRKLHGDLDDDVAEPASAKKDTAADEGMCSGPPETSKDEDIKRLEAEVASLKKSNEELKAKLDTCSASKPKDEL
eukprot:m.208768 g.208768  ORF g.208768 m.208768 type:complete len:429 (+) comp18541_c0_seq2:1422-2708(+)